MSKFTEKAQYYRDVKDRHYNCAQSVFLSFAEAKGLDVETAYKISANFGGGMKRKSVCGAVTGGLMALGLYGMTDEEALAAYHDKVRSTHDGLLDCGPLLERNAAMGGDKKQHCDAIVCECAGYVEEILKEKGLL